MTEPSPLDLPSRLEAYEAAALSAPRALPRHAEGAMPASALDLFDAAPRDAAALFYFDGRVDYATLDGQADALAAWWQARGVGRGDRVAIVLQNVPAFVIAVVAAWKLGAIAVALNPMYRVPELTKLFADCRPSAALCHDDQWAAVAEAGAGVFGPEAMLWTSPHEGQSRGDLRVLPARPAEAPPAEQSLSAVLASGAQPARVERPAADDVAVLLYTSGTTGLPKGAMLLHRNLVFNALTCARHFELDRDSRVYGIAPLFHVTGFEAQMVMAFAAGASMVLGYRFQPAVVLDAFVEHRPTFIIGAITAFIALMNRPETTPAHFASFDRLYSGGAPISPSTVEAFQRRYGRAIRSSYGMTELTAPSHLAPAEGPIPVDPASGALSIGQATAGVDAIVVGDDGRPVAPGTHGEIVVRGPDVMAGYWGKPVETAEALKGGWMHTGDIGFVDAGGWFYLVDRKKDMISASGFKVWPREVEDVLYAYAGVREAAVVGAPDDYRGETVVAYVSAAEGATIDAASLREHCRQRLAAYKVPTAIHVLPDLPKTETGKITRAVLAKRLRDQPAST